MSFFVLLRNIKKPYYVQAEEKSGRPVKQAYISPKIVVRAFLRLIKFLAAGSFFSLTAPQFFCAENEHISFAPKKK